MPSPGDELEDGTLIIGRDKLYVTYRVAEQPPVRGGRVFIVVKLGEPDDYETFIALDGGKSRYLQGGAGRPVRMLSRCRTRSVGPSGSYRTPGRAVTAKCEIDAGRADRPAPLRSWSVKARPHA